jgi:exodeoxyribonuclease V beta subunit
LITHYDLRVNQVLVVTYTDAATAELRDRIRKRLAEALAFLEEQPTDESYAELLQATELDKATLVRRLQRALVSFDEAAVYTIHGFCKRVLTDNAFEAHLRFESELVANEDNLLTELSDQFWYQYFHKPDALHSQLLQTYKLTPDGLLKDVRTFIGKPYLTEPVLGVNPANFQTLKQALDQQLSVCGQTWAKQRAVIQQMLWQALQDKVLNGRSYREEKLTLWYKALDDLFANYHLSSHASEALVKLSADFMAGKLNKNKVAPKHLFFTQVQAAAKLQQDYLDFLPLALEQVRLNLLHHLRVALPKRKQQLGILTFDDLLIHLREVLAKYPSFASRLADKFPAALIDEFQDTDPIQYAIFNTIYEHKADKRLFFVGDPKQAIYGFRGADIHTYLKASRRVDHRYTLAHNYRSHENFLRALNHLFTQSRQPFRNEIAYEEVSAGKAQADLQIDPPLPSLRLWDWDRLEQEANVTQVQDEIAEAVADDIARLLNLAQQGKAKIGEQAIQSRDIAVLVRTNPQGERVKQALLKRGIASVKKSRESIFQTREAAALRAFLRAVAAPKQQALIKQALVSELFGYNATQLLELDTQADALDKELESFEQWHQTWLQRGFMSMFRQWMIQRKRYAFLLSLPDGERRLTNLLHLAEIVHTESRLKGHGMQTVIRWLQHQANLELSENEHELRLESDENLVQIVTIHKSKGLEYGIVYCPYLWYEREPRALPTWFNWYDSQTDLACLQPALLASEPEKIALRQAEQAENLRLLYVALTRAKYHCTIGMVSGHIKQFDYYSGLGWLLFGDLGNSKDILGKAIKESPISPAERQSLMQKRIKQIVNKSQGLMRYEALPILAEPQRYQSPPSANVLNIRHFKNRIPPVPKVGSFSGLTAGLDDEQPDYDVMVWQSLPITEGTQGIFPRGAQAGSCLHQMLEKLDFMQAISEQRDSVLVPALDKHGIKQMWLTAVEVLLNNTLQTPLTEGFSLSQLPKSQRLDELEFYFPIQQLKVGALQRVLVDHLPTDWHAIQHAVQQLNFKQLTGYMKGFIDLIYEYQGRYYIVDYKSNDLGSAFSDYTFDAMLNEMAAHHYYLQFLIYCVALHRYLNMRLPAYDWHQHFGGVQYLFLRGMNPYQAGSGVFAYRPDWAFIQALDALFN